VEPNRDVMVISLCWIEDDRHKRRAEQPGQLKWNFGDTRDVDVPFVALPESRGIVCAKAQSICLRIGRRDDEMLERSPAPRFSGNQIPTNCKSEPAAAIDYSIAHHYWCRGELLFAEFDSRCSRMFRSSCRISSYAQFPQTQRVARDTFVKFLFQNLQRNTVQRSSSRRGRS
jgi:hypothetical protein